MGNKQTVTSAGDGREDGWLVVDIFPEDAISFSPESSYAVCAGTVGPSRWQYMY
jgi:hypothetical protein